MNRIFKYRDGNEAGLMRCDCGKKHEIFDASDIDCSCGRSYNSAGQQLAPREQWGEECGESASDYDQGFANPERAFDDY